MVFCVSIRALCFGALLLALPVLAQTPGSPDEADPNFVRPQRRKR